MNDKIADHGKNHSLGAFVSIEVPRSAMLPSATQIAIIVTVCVIVTLLVALFVAVMLPAADDWHQTLRPASFAILRGESPYSVPTYVSPPWVAVALVPLAILPEALGRGVLFVLTVLSVAYVARRMGADRVTMALLFVSPMMLDLLLTGNVDGLLFPFFVVTLGRAGQAGMAIALLSKPQITIVYLIWRMHRWVRLHSVRDNAIKLIYVFIVVIASFVLWGFWPIEIALRASDFLTAGRNYFSLWPWLVPVGLVLTVKAFRERDYRYGVGASPFLAPYVMPYSWAVVLLMLVRDRWVMGVAVVGSWAVVAIRVAGG